MFAYCTSATASCYIKLHLVKFHSQESQSGSVLSIVILSSQTTSSCNIFSNFTTWLKSCDDFDAWLFSDSIWSHYLRFMLLTFWVYAHVEILRCYFLKYILGWIDSHSAMIHFQPWLIYIQPCCICSLWYFTAGLDTWYADRILLDS